MEHRHGSVGIFSRWWYDAKMYKPELLCHRCRKPPEDHPKARIALWKKFQPVSETQHLYVVPRVWPPGTELNHEQMLYTWPRHEHGKFALGGSGESMFDLTEEEWRALQIVVLRTDVRKEHYGAAHQFNWKKVGLSKAYFKSELVSAARMPTPKAAAALDYLMQTYYV